MFKREEEKKKRVRVELVNDLRDRGQEGPALAAWSLQGGRARRDVLARALESGEHSGELCAVCFRREGRLGGGIQKAFTPCPLSYCWCAPALSFLARALLCP